MEFDFENFFVNQLVPVASKKVDLYQPKKENEQIIMDNYLAFNKTSQQHIDVFNQFIKKSANIISSKIITLDNGRTIHFENLQCTKPIYINHKNNTEHDLTPQIAREKEMTYASEWTVDLVIKINNKVVFTSKNRIPIVKIPVMLHSNLCHLEGKTSSELIALGEDPIEQGGYFIVSGVEKIIMLEEKLSTNRIFIMPSSPKVNKKYRTNIRLTTNTSKGTAVNELIFNVNNVMKYSFQSLHKKKEPEKNEKFEKTKKLNVIYVFQLFSMLYFNDTYTNDDIMNLIKPYLIKPSSIKFLYSSMAAVSAINMGKDPVSGYDILIRKMMIENLSDQEKLTKVKLLFREIYEHLYDIDPYDGEKVKAYELRIVKTKINLLALMVAQYLDYLAGVIPLDDRDDWANKRVEGPGRKMEQLLRSSWNKVLKDIEMNKLRKDMDNNSIETAFRGHEPHDKINKIFNECFINSKWGLKQSNQKNNATQTLSRDNIMASLSHINTINVNIQRTDKDIAKRMVQYSQAGYVSYIKTPESDQCGFVKNIAQTTKLSLDRGVDGDRIIWLVISDLVTDRDISHTHIVMLNGKMVGWCEGWHVRDVLIQARRRGEIYYDTSLFINNQFLYIDASPSRLIRPLLIVKDGKLLTDDAKSLDPDDLIQSGAMEFVSAWEEKNLKVAENYDALIERYNLVKNLSEEELIAFEQLNRPFTHCEISPRAAFGIADEFIPLPQHNQAPRNMYQSGMGTQAVSSYHLNYKSRFDGTQKILESPVPPIVRTATSQLLGIAERGMGQNVIIAIMAMPKTEEDSFILNQGSIDRGLFRMVKEFTVDGKIKLTDPNVHAHFGKPALQPDDKPDKYDHINESGLPIMNSYITEGQCVIGIIKEKSDGKKVSASVFLGPGERGRVTQVLISEQPTTKTVRVKLTVTRLPKVGDKYAARQSQKGTIGNIWPAADMPFEEDTGMVPDMIMNPAAIPSRMTISLILEMIAGKQAAYFGETVDASAFQ